MNHAENTMPETMNAVMSTTYGPPEVLRHSVVAKPVPNDDEVLIKVRATTVTVADVRVRSFTVPRSFWIPARISLGIVRPKKTILGSEVAGEVEAVGGAVTKFKPGDRVFASTLPDFGGYAQYVCVRHDRPIALMPSNLTFEEAAAVPIGGRTALHYVSQAGIGRGTKVLVYGASGSVGSYAVQLAKRAGATVTGVCSAANVELVRSLGADKVIDYTREDFTQNGERYDVIFVAVDKCPFAACARSLANDGIYLNVTQPLPTPGMLWASVTTRKRLILGQNPPQDDSGLVALKELIEAGELRAVVDRCYPLERIVEAHRYVDTGRKRGNVVVRVGHDADAE